MHIDEVLVYLKEREESNNHINNCKELCDEERCSYTLNNNSKMCDDCGKVFDYKN